MRAHLCPLERSSSGRRVLHLPFSSIIPLFPPASEAHGKDVCVSLASIYPAPTHRVSVTSRPYVRSCEMGTGAKPPGSEKAQYPSQKGLTVMWPRVAKCGAPRSLHSQTPSSQEEVIIPNKNKVPFLRLHSPKRGVCLMVQHLKRNSKGNSPLKSYSRFPTKTPLSIRGAHRGWDTERGTNSHRTGHDGVRDS